MSLAYAMRVCCTSSRGDPVLAVLRVQSWLFSASGCAAYVAADAAVDAAHFHDMAATFASHAAVDMAADMAADAAIDAALAADWAADVAVWAADAADDAERTVALADDADVFVNVDSSLLEEAASYWDAHTSLLSFALGSAAYCAADAADDASDFASLAASFASGKCLDVAYDAYVAADMADDAAFEAAIAACEAEVAADDSKRIARFRSKCVALCAAIWHFPLPAHVCRAVGEVYRVVVAGTVGGPLRMLSLNDQRRRWDHHPNLFSHPVALSGRGKGTMLNTVVNPAKYLQEAFLGASSDRKVCLLVHRSSNSSSTGWRGVG